MYDCVDEHGILVQRYGPHIFHTGNQEVIDYVQQHGEWQDFHLVCGAEIDGITTPTPFNFQTIDDFYSPEDAAELKRRIGAAFPGREFATVVEVLEHPDPMIRGYAEFLFEKDYSLYTAKQWGISPAEIDVSVLKRVPLRFSYADGYFDDPYQAMPKVSYTHFFETLLDHPNISVELEVDALDHLIVSGNQLLFDGKPLTVPCVYTGPLDELFGFNSGPLPYRSLRFEWKHEDIDSKQAAPVVAYPQAEGFTRITEYKKLPIQDAPGTTYAVEYSLQYDPDATNEPYYPIPTDSSQAAYDAYAEQAAQIPNLYCCGRLADFKYYNMDQALARALDVAQIVFSD